MNLQNPIYLITYPDSLGKNLQEVHYVLKRFFEELIGGVHLLPFYPSSADRGFAPITYYQVDPSFGTWDDIALIREDFDLMIDFMVNHISRQSEYFTDYLENGSDSKWADLFISFSKLRRNGPINDRDLENVYTRKPAPPYQVIERPGGSKETIWSTFDFEQIDLDVKSPLTRELFRDFLIFLSRKKPSFIRMDAFAYTTIEIGTNCFFREPAVWNLLEFLKKCVSPFGVRMLPEVHEKYTYQLKLAKNGYWTYDFALPILVIHTLYHHTNKRLLRWLKICPRKQFTTLDTHDGLGIVDVESLLTHEEIEKVVNGLYEKGSNMKPIYSSASYNNMDIYQINCTYFSALETNDDSYIAARAIQFFTPGIPMVYYVGALAGENDIELVESTRHGRDINRHYYTIEEIEKETERPVVQRLFRLMKFRNTYPAFDGDLIIEDSKDSEIILTWDSGEHRATLAVDLHSYQTRVKYNDTKTHKQKQFTA